MKKLISLFLVCALFSGCTQNGTETTTTATTTTTTTASTTTSTTTTESTTTTPVTTTAPQTTTTAEVTEDISAVLGEDDEFYIEKGKYFANVYKELFDKYLVYDISKLGIEHEVVTEYTDEMLDDIPPAGEGLCLVTEEGIESYSDIEAIFLESCTKEFATELLKETSHLYAESGGKLYFADSILCDSGSYATCYITDYEINGNKIVYKLYLEGVSGASRNEEYNKETFGEEINDDKQDETLTMTLVYKDGEFKLCDADSNIGLCYGGSHFYKELLKDYSFEY